MNKAFGGLIRKKREELRKSDSNYSLRKVAIRIGVEPSYLSKIERGEMSPPSEEKIRALSIELSVDVDILLAMAGKVSTDLQIVIKKRPALFAKLIREIKDMPDNAVLRIVREVRDGDW